MVLIGRGSGETAIMVRMESGQARRETRGLVSDTERLIQVLERLDRTVGRVDRGYERVARRTTRVSRATSSWFGVLGGGVALRAATQTLGSYGVALARTRGILAENIADHETLDLVMERLTGRVRELARTQPFTGTEIAGANLDLIRTGFSDQEASQALAPSLNLAFVAQQDLTRATEIGAKTQRIFNQDASQTARVMDVLANTAAGTSQDIGELFETFKEAPVATAAGISLSGVAAAAGILADNGLAGSRGGTQLRISIASLLQPTAQARRALAGLNLDADDLRDALGRDGLVGALDLLASRSPAVEDLLAIFQRRGVAGASALLRNVDALRALRDSNDAVSGSLERQAALISQQLPSKFRELASVVEDTVLTVGERGAGRAIASTTEFLTEGVRGLSNYERGLTAVQTTATGVVGALGAAGLTGTLVGLSRFLGTGGVLVGGLAGLAVAARTAFSTVSEEVKRARDEVGGFGRDVDIATRLAVSAGARGDRTTEERELLAASRAAREQAARIGAGSRVGDDSRVPLFDLQGGVRGDFASPEVLRHAVRQAMRDFDRGSPGTASLGGAFSGGRRTPESQQIIDQLRNILAVSQASPQASVIDLVQQLPEAVRQSLTVDRGLAAGARRQQGDLFESEESRLRNSRLIGELGLPSFPPSLAHLYGPQSRGPFSLAEQGLFPGAGGGAGGAGGPGGDAIARAREIRETEEALLRLRREIERDTDIVRASGAERAEMRAVDQALRVATQGRIELEAQVAEGIRRAARERFLAEERADRDQQGRSLGAEAVRNTTALRESIDNRIGADYASAIVDPFVNAWQQQDWRGLGRDLFVRISTASAEALVARPIEIALQGIFTRTSQRVGLGGAEFAATVSASSAEFQAQVRIAAQVLRQALQGSGNRGNGALPFFLQAFGSLAGGNPTPPGSGPVGQGPLAPGQTFASESTGGGRGARLVPSGPVVVDQRTITYVGFDEPAIRQTREVRDIDTQARYQETSEDL